MTEFLLLPDGSICSSKLFSDRYSRDYTQQKMPRNADHRTECERDVGRIRYSASLMRLSGVAQVTTPDPSIVRRHDRLTHTLKVAGLAREIASDLVRQAMSDESDRRIKAAILAYGGLDISACEAGGLVHDLGHAPFAHSSEGILDNWLREGGDEAGFEGNAQSIRVVRRLEPRNPNFQGLGLTTLTIGAALKYPWLRDLTNNVQRHKFSVYPDDRELLAIPVRVTGLRYFEGRQTLEASIVEVADDLTYAIHDLQDFVESRVIDLSSALPAIKDVAQTFLRENVDLSSVNHGLAIMAQRLGERYGIYSNREFGGALQQLLLKLQGIENEKSDSYISIANIRQTFSSIISDILEGLIICDPHEGEVNGVSFTPQAWHKLHALKLIGRYYAIENASVARQERSNQAALTTLLEALLDWTKTAPAHSLPSPLGEYVRIVGRAPRNDSPLLRRAIVDFVCGMTDRQCLRLAAELNGGELPVV